MRGLILCMVSLFCSGPWAAAQVILDESLDDWEEGSIISDPLGDASSAFALDIIGYGSSNDQERVFFALELREEELLQEGNNLVIYVDIDGNESTGRSVEGLGADLEFDFGERQGRLYANGSSREIRHDDIGLVSSPTVSSEFFEISVDRDLGFLAGVDLVFDDSFSYVWKDVRSSGDRAPDTGVARAELTDAEISYIVPIHRSDNVDIRVMSYNLLRDLVFESAAAEEAFGRILRATEPDIIAIQEVYDNSSLAMANLVSRQLSPPIGGQWYHAKIDPDIIVVSLFPIRDVEASDGNGLFLIELPTADLLIANCHLPCCENDFDRQRETDRLLAEIRDIQDGIGSVELAEDSPIIICGDMNLVGDRQTQQSLISGDIVDNGLFGPDFLLDWGTAGLFDNIPQTTGLPMSFTWINERGSFFPGRLDYLLHTASVLELQSSFSLYTQELDTDTLIAYGLSRFDTDLVSDHLPIVSDYRIATSTSTVDDTFGRQPSADKPTDCYHWTDWDVATNGMSDLVIWSHDDLIGQGPSGQMLYPTLDLLPAGMYRVLGRRDGQIHHVLIWKE